MGSLCPRLPEGICSEEFTLIGNIEKHIWVAFFTVGLLLDRLHFSFPVLVQMCCTRWERIWEAQSISLWEWVHEMGARRTGGGGDEGCTGRFTSAHAISLMKLNWDVWFLLGTGK